MDDSSATSFSSADVATFLEISQALLCVVDRRGHLLRISRSWETVLGWDVDGMLGHHFQQYLHPDDAASTLAQLAANGDSRQSIVNRYRHSDGSYRALRWETRVGADGSVWCIAHDVTTELVRADQQHFVADLGRLALDGACLDDLLGAAVLGVARGLALPIVVVLELRPHGKLEMRTALGVPHDPQAPVLLAVDDLTVTGHALTTGRTATAEDVQAERTPHPLQRAYGAHGALAVPIGRPGAPWGALSGADTRPRRFDSAEQRFLEQVAHVLGAAISRLDSEHRLEHQATHDSLTDLPNRDLLRDRMHAALDGERAVGLLLCDLDGFKDVNDSLGHAAGDAVLQQLARRLAAAVGPGDTVARLGGDEFAICVVDVTTEIEVLGVADAIVHAMRVPFSLPELEVPLSTSIGVVVSPAHGRDASTLLRHADVAMYRAKAGHLGWSLYDPSVDGARSDRLVLTADLRGAIATDALQLHYQPVIDLATGQLHSVEALCRWVHRDRGTIMPATFIPLAEQTGEVLPLTTWVVRRAAAQVRSWRAAGHDVMCAVNLSMAAVADDRASAALLDELIEVAHLLTVEITESWLADARGQEVIAKLAASGVRLSLDDFGTGFSSLASLRSFPVNQLKLDRQFVLDLEDDRGHEVLLAVTQLGTALGMDVVAEGIEDRRTADRLLAAGLHLGQGFLWAPALTPDEMEAWFPVPAKQRA